jgi:hypothetical protein
MELLTGYGYEGLPEVVATVKNLYNWRAKGITEAMEMMRNR